MQFRRFFRRQSVSSSEGYIKFNVDRIDGPPPDPSIIRTINEVRTRLLDLGLIGINTDGVGYGNVSVRGEDSQFYITVSRSGATRILSPEEFARVDSFDIDRNYVRCVGAKAASSESMSHGAIYLVNEDIHAVIHVHHEGLFSWLIGGGWATTPPYAEYGTPEMSREIMDLVTSMETDTGVFATEGHEEGVFAFGSDEEVAEEALMSVYEAYEEGELG